MISTLRRLFGRGSRKTAAHDKAESSYPPPSNRLSGCDPAAQGEKAQSAGIPAPSDRRESPQRTHGQSEDDFVATLYDDFVSAKPVPVESASESTNDIQTARQPRSLHSATLRVDGPSGEQSRDQDESPVATRRSGRVKTRLLGLENAAPKQPDVFEKKEELETSDEAEFPVGWLVIVEGPGRGSSFSLRAGVSQIGRGEGQEVRLDFGDETISRDNHAAIAYDEAKRSFFVGHGGKSNLVRLNGDPLLSTEMLKGGDELRIGETTLRLVALCDEGFSWVGRTGKLSAANG